MTTKQQLGVCYYPEHWPESKWPDDAAAMRALGLSLVRIGEFAWSRIEPAPGEFDWAWLDRAVDTLAGEGLQIIMGTPTACPPKWLIDKYPEVLPLDEHGHPRRFGSRRHYCFSSETYRREALRIVNAMTERYGSNPAIIGWQLDNEYGCHATTTGLSANALAAFRKWLAVRYESIDKLNHAWGTVFWSQTYRSFDEIDFPVATVTEANPVHRLDHWRFSSDQVARFNRLQADAVRHNVESSSWLTHNFMGNFTEFDHYQVAADLDIASWDSYPLGFLETGWFTDDEKNRWRDTGHPDWAAFHHDLYRGVGSGRFAVMEQQPGPVNWAPANAAPLEGMVRLWTWEALAHGAEFVSYFRWRQAAFGQEQMHAGLQLPDGTEAPCMTEIRQAADELNAFEFDENVHARVALLFNYESCAMTRLQPHGDSGDPLETIFDYYTSLRALGLNVDILPCDADLAERQLIVIPSIVTVSDDLVDRLEASNAQVVIGPRSGSRTKDFQLPPELPPGPFHRLVPVRVESVDVLRPGHSEDVLINGEKAGARRGWLEHLQTDLAAEAQTKSGRGTWYRNDRFHYLSTRPDASLLTKIMVSICVDAGLNAEELPRGLRYRRRGRHCFAFNYGPEVAMLDVPAELLLLGETELQPGGVAAWVTDT